jgi:AraC-like DNA-binding protein
MDTLAALLDPEHHADISLAGHPLAYLRASSSWDTGRRELEQHLLYVLESGNIMLWHNETQVVVKAGSVILLKPGSSFRMQATGGIPGPAFWRLRISLPVPWKGPTVVSNCVDLVPVVAALIGEVPEGRPYRAERIRGLLIALLARLLRGAETTELSAGPLPLDTGARQQIERHVATDPCATPRDLARLLDLTLDYFTRQFRATYGFPPRRWLLERRLLAAAVALSESSESITAIGRQLGFSDPRRFSRSFRQRFGLSPGRYRTGHGLDG